MTERFFSTFQIASLLRAAPGQVVEWMVKGWLNSTRSPGGVSQVSESDLVRFLEDQSFDFGDELDGTLTPEQRDEAYRRARDRKAVANSAGTTTATITPNKQTPKPALPIVEPTEPVIESPPPTPRPEPEPEPHQPPAPPVDPEPAKPQAGQICDAILSDAVRHGASAIHLTPLSGGLKLQLRINGSLHEKPHFDQRLPDSLKREIIACMLNRADPDIVPGDLAVPRSIEFSRPIEGLQLTLRLSVLPTVNGPRLVISMPPAREALVLEVSARTKLEQLLQGDGLIVVAAKRKIGRDQTLRTLLASCDTTDRSVIAIEQNSKPHLDGVAQLQLNPPAGLTCATATAAIEDQDADTILLTELRDPSTAFGAFEAAHDGALVIAGINASSALEATSELLAMGLEPWPLGRTLKAIVEQVSVRTLCPHCDDGCDRCEQTGWSGRTVLSGVVFIEGELADLIRKGAPPEQLTQAFAQAGPGSLAHAAQAAVDAGVTTPAEVAHILIRN